MPKFRAMRVATIASRARKDARAIERAEAERAAGIPDRTDIDCRTGGKLDLRWCGGPVLDVRPWRDHKAVIATDAQTGELFARCAPKALFRHIADRLPQHISPRSAAD